MDDAPLQRVRTFLKNQPRYKPYIGILDILYIERRQQPYYSECISIMLGKQIYDFEWRGDNMTLDISQRDNDAFSLDGQIECHLAIDRPHDEDFRAPIQCIVTLFYYICQFLGWSAQFCDKYVLTQ